MGIYHYLKVHTGSGATDIGGYSKGGSKRTWFFAFSPTEYVNNLEELVGTERDQDAKVGYKTSVGKAISRLSAVKDFLPTVKNHLMTQQDKQIHYTTEDEVDELLKRLKEYNPNDTLVLDQRDGTYYSFVFDKSKPGFIIGLCDTWYQNTSGEIGNQLYRWKLPHLNLMEVIESFANTLPNKELNEFFGELIETVSHNERSYGPNDITEFLLEYDKKNLNNPRELFLTVATHFVKEYNVEVHEKWGYCATDSEAAINLMVVLIGLESEIGEALDMLNKYQKI